MTHDFNDLSKKDSSIESAGAVPESAFHSELHNATILLMRHAEKPDDPGDPNLSQAGLARANALADYIPANFGRKPDYLFAAADSRESSRPFETLEPLSHKTGVPIDASISDKDYRELAQELKGPKYDGKFIVIAWHHGKMPELANKLGAPAGSYPNPWPGDDFGDALEFDYNGDGIPKVKIVHENIKTPESN